MQCEGCPIRGCNRLEVFGDEGCRLFLLAVAEGPPPPPAAPDPGPPRELPIYRQRLANRVYRRIASCSHRVKLPPEEQEGCGCKYRCTAGRSDFADGKVSLECYRCEKERVRVAFWGTSFWHAGGTETWHAHVAKHFDPSRIAILGYAVEGAPNPDLGSSMFAPYRFGVGRDAAAEIALDAEVVVAWGVGPTFRELLPEDWPGKVVAVCHGDAHTRFSPEAMALAEPYADLMAAVSEPAMDSIPEGWRPEAWLIRNALDEPEEGRTAWARNREASTRRIGYLGRYTGEKRPQLVARAARHLPDGYEVELAGPPPEWLSRSLGEDEGPPARVPVVARGYLERGAAREFLRGLGALVVPSESEGFGFVIGEAWGLGVPVIATPRGLAGLHPDCCTLLPPDPTPAEIALAAESLWADPSRTTEQVDRARAVVREHYSPEAWARAWEDRIIALARGDARQAEATGSPPGESDP